MSVLLRRTINPKDVLFFLASLQIGNYQLILFHLEVNIFSNIKKLECFKDIDVFSIFKDLKHLLSEIPRDFSTIFASNNWFTVVSTLFAAYCTYLLFFYGQAATEPAMGLSLFLIAWLAALAVLEHCFLMIPMGETALWR